MKFRKSWRENLTFSRMSTVAPHAPLQQLSSVSLEQFSLAIRQVEMEWQTCLPAFASLFIENNTRDTQQHPRKSCSSSCFQLHSSLQQLLQFLPSHSFKGISVGLKWGGVTLVTFFQLGTKRMTSLGPSIPGCDFAASSVASDT